MPVVSTVGVLFVLGRKVFLNSVGTPEIVAKSADFASGTNLMSSAPETDYILTNAGFFSNFVGWELFLLGLWAGIVLFFVLSYIYERRSK